MRPGGITVALAVYWLAGVVGAASLPPGDQYSPQPSPYRRDVAHGPRGYPNWLQYRQDSNTEFDPPEAEPVVTTLKASDLSWESKLREDTLLRDPELSALSPRSRKVATSRANDNFAGRARSNLDVPVESDVSSASREDPFTVDDTFQDQGPGSVEVYKLDLLRENSILVPEARKRQRQLTTKSKIPKKTPAEEILWKLKPIEPSKVSLPAIFRRPARLENRKDEVFAVGGVPELQVGCEGLEASDRRRRSSDPGEESTDEDSENWQKFKIPVYKESTEPILSRVTPIVLDFDEELPSGEVYEEMDELLKLKKLESTSPTPTTRRRNRADIDPALAIHHDDDLVNVETFPERGDLGPVSNASSRVKRSIRPEGSQDTSAMGAMYKTENDVKDDDTSTAIVESPSEIARHHGGRKLLWMQYPERQEADDQGRRGSHQSDNDLWGFGEDDGEISGVDDDSEAEQLRRAEMEKRRREDERRRQEELERRRGSHGHRPHSQEQHPGNRDANAEAERIRMEYERQLEKEQRERQRMEKESRGHGDRRQWEDERRRTEEANRLREEESRRRMVEEDERNRRTRPSPLTRPDQPHRVDNRTRIRQEDSDAEERKLREYIERNRPIDPRSREDRRRPEGESRWRNDDEERRRRMEEERRRQQMEEHRRRQQQPDEDDRRRQQMEEHRRRQQQLEEDERRRQMEEHRRKQHQPDEEERRRQMEEHRRRQHQPDEEERRRQMEEQRRRQHQPDDEERRRQMEEQRRRQHRPDDEERRRQMEEHRRRQQQPDEEERRRQMEEQRRRQQHPDEYERRRQMEEQRRRSHPDNRTMEDERRRRLEEERKLQDYVRRNQPVNVPRRNNSEVFASRERDLDEQRRTLEAARQYERNRAESSRMNGGRIHGPSAPTNIGHRQSQTDLEEMRRRQEVDIERRRLENEERKREEEYRRIESRRREDERRRLEETRRNEENRRSQSESGRPSWHDSGSRRPANTQHRGGSASGEARDREAEELRRRESAGRTSARNPENEWRRRAEERERQRQQEERDRARMENERNSRNNGRRRPQHGDSGFKEHRQRGGIVGSSDERRRREHARLSSLPVSARIIVRSNDGSRPTGGSQVATRPTTSIDTRANFDNDVDFPPINPHRPGLSAPRFPAPATRRPPVESPGACVWAIVQCCPANNRLTTCFESMGCPGINWDPNPCRGSLAEAAQAEVVRFYEAAEEDRRRY